MGLWTALKVRVHIFAYCNTVKRQMDLHDSSDEAELRSAATVTLTP